MRVVFLTFYPPGSNCNALILFQLNSTSKRWKIFPNKCQPIWHAFVCILTNYYFIVSFSDEKPPVLYIVINKMCMPNVCHFSHRVFSTHFEFRYLTYIICIQKKPNCMFMFCLDFLTIQLLFGLQEGPYRIVFARKCSYHCHPSLPCLSPAPVERFDDVHIFSANGVHCTLNLPYKCCYSYNYS